MFGFGAAILRSRLVSNLKAARRRVLGKKNPSRARKNPSDPVFDKLKKQAERGLRRKLTTHEQKQLRVAITEYREFHDADPTTGTMVKVPDGSPSILAAAGEMTETNYRVGFQNSARKGMWTHAAGDHGRTGKKTKAPYLAWVPGKKGPPLFAQPRGADLRFKPSHGIVG